MAIREDGVSAVSVGELLEQNLRIPHYQRPYSWEPVTAIQLVDDVEDALHDPRRNGVPYVLGAVILHRHDDVLDVVDGQQRLLTLRMILGILKSANRPRFRPNPANPIGRVSTALRRRLNPLLRPDRQKLHDFINDGCRLVRVVTDDVDEAFRVFDSQNYRGKPLRPHDLLKAYHLREMRDESGAMKAAVVETWESVKDDDLDRLFSTYLYRIARWSRGEHAPRFTAQDIGMFKGVSPQKARTPSARYHLAAQAALPMLSAWSSSDGLDAREAGRSRFQLDAPVLAGRPFFEMVAFFLGELKRLAGEAFEGEAEQFCLYDLNALKTEDALEERWSWSRYRYVSELYLAGLLYYTNKFGDSDLEQARVSLFAWAYAIRVGLLRVQFRSMDNRGAGDWSTPSAFGLLRNAASGRVVSQLSQEVNPPNEDFERPLVALLRRQQVQ